MVNANTLLMESHNFPKTLETDNRAFLEFLGTMAKYHKYDIPQQVSLHLHAPRKASAVATREVWERYFGTEPLPEAEEIPAIVKSKDGSYQAVTLYDIQDTAYYRTLSEQGILDEIPSIPWKYEADVHGAAVMQALGSAASGTPNEAALSAALHQAVLQKVLARRSDYSSLLLAATEYVARERLGLPANPSVLQSISRDGIPMDRFLAEVNAEVKEVLSPVAAAVKIIDDQRVEAWEAEHNVDGERNLNEALRGVRERGARTAARGQEDVAGNARGGDARRVSDEVRGREDGAVPESRGSAREELERDGGTQEEGSRGVDAGNEHGTDVGARDADARLSADSAQAATSKMASIGTASSAESRENGEAEEAASGTPSSDSVAADLDHPRNAGELSVAYVLDHFEDALRIVPSGRSLAAIVGYGAIPDNAEESLRELARLHQAGKYQKKIEDFLAYADDPRYPNALRDFREGNYDAYLPDAHEDKASATEAAEAETPPASDREEDAASDAAREDIRGFTSPVQPDMSEEETRQAQQRSDALNHVLFGDAEENTAADTSAESAARNAETDTAASDARQEGYELSLTEEYVSSHWEEVLTLVPDVATISDAIGYGFSEADIAELARLHQAGKFQEKIEDLLEDCNFHPERADFHEGNYAPYLPENAREVSAAEAAAPETPPASDREKAEAPAEEAPASSEMTDSPQREYKYYMNHRPLGIGAQPNGFTRFDEEDPRGRYGAIYYDHPLSEKEIQNYELTEAEENRSFTQNAGAAAEDVPSASPEAAEETDAAEETPSPAESVEEADAPTEEAEEAAREGAADEEDASSEDGETDSADAKQAEAEEAYKAEPIDLSTLDFEADLSTTRGKRAVFRRNLAAIQIIHRLDRMQAKPTDEEKRVLASYEGWGGLPEAFDTNIPSWKAEQDALRAELSDKEYTAARASTLNAHYTPDEIVRGIYAGLHRLGFEYGNILDPAMGTGRFFSVMPPSMRNQSHLFGVELDAVSAKISSYLHEDTEVAHQGFETTTFPDNSFDLAITNVPFGNYKVEDATHRGLSVHNYFTTKMLDEVRPGGLVAVITSSYTMDQKDSSMRRALARHADLVSAVRLPNTAFSADGTEVVSDILIFQKREKERLPDELSRLRWLDTEEVNVFDKDGRLHQERINEYFDTFPEHVLGKTVSQSGPFGYRLSVDADAAHPMTGAAIADALSADAEKRYVPITPADGEELPVPQQKKEPDRAKPSGYYMQDGELVYRDSSGVIVSADVSEKEKGQLQAAISVRDAVRTLYDAELRSCSDEELANLQQQLQIAYDAYQKKYGRFNEMKRNFKKTFSRDSGYTLLLSLETYEEGKFQHLSDMFTKRTIHAYRPPTHADTPEEALMISMQERGEVNLPYMAKLTGDTEENLVSKLEFHSIYEDMQAHRFVPADEFLSGDVRKKMAFLSSMQKKWEGELHTLASDSLYPPMKSDYHLFEDHELESWDINSRNEMYQLLHTDFQKDIYARIVNNKEYFGDREEMTNLSKEEVERLVQPENINLLVQFIDHNNLSDAFKNPHLASYQQDPRFWFSLMRHGLRAPLPSIAHAYPACEYLTDALYAVGAFNMPYDYSRNRGAFGGVQAAFLEQKFKDYEDGRREQNREGFRVEYEAFRQKAKDSIAQYMKESDDPMLSSLRQDIARCKSNYAALDNVKPKDLTADEVSINLGASWIPTEVIENFAADTFQLRPYELRNFHVLFAQATCTWKIDGKPKESGNSNLIEKYGLPEKNAAELLETALNQRSAKIYKKVEIDGEEKRVIDRKRTLLANSKIEAIRNAFTEWLAKNPETRDKLVTYYNETFNSIVPRSFDGSKLQFPGMNPEITLKPHQKNAVARTLYGGNTLLAHVVGAGKTFEMQASAMEAKRIGLSKKSLMIMPGHLTEQFGAEFLRLYPSARVLVANESDYKNADTRRLFALRVANEDWDAVVMSYEQFEKIPLSTERQKEFLLDELAKAEKGIEELQQGNRYGRGKNWTLKQIEAYKAKLAAQFDKLNDASKRADKDLTFEQLGIDRLYVDESHYYKNLAFVTKMDGFSTQMVQKTGDLLGKIHYLNELTNERGVVFASGTPISNSMSELYTLQRYLRPSRLAEKHVTMFDSWASTFGRPVTQMEISPDGTTFQAKTRFSKFQNLPELMCMFKEFADVQTADMLNLPVPESSIELQVTKPTAVQQQIMADIADRAEAIRQRKPQQVTKKDGTPCEDNMLMITNAGRALSLSPKLVDPSLPADEPGKIEQCTDNVAKIYQDTAKDKLTQIIFCDLGTPKAKSDKDSFTVYDTIKQELIEKGVKENEIAFIHDCKTNAQKLALFDRVRKGEIRVLLGSSDKLGVGTNVQDRLIATHDLDCPWKPSQIEQRRGRIVRRGNQNKKVKIYRYVTENTFDTYLWQTNENKQRFISQIMTSRTPVREATDVDATMLDYTTTKCLCTGNPKFKEKMELERDLEILKADRSQYLDNQEKLKKRIFTKYPQEIERITAKRDVFAKDAKVIAAHAKEPLVIDGKTYTEPEKIGKVLAELADGIQHNKLDHTPTGSFRGLKLAVLYDYEFKRPVIRIGKFASLTVNIVSSSPKTNVERLLATQVNIKSSEAFYQKDLNEVQHDLDRDKEAYGKPFEHEAEYQEKSARYAEISAEIESETSADLKEETNQRLNQITGVIDVEDATPADSLYIDLARHAFLENNREWDEHFDEQIAAAMLDKGFSPTDTQKTIVALSPSIPDKDKVKGFLPQGDGKGSFSR